MKYGKQLREVVADLEAVSGDLNSLAKYYQHPELKGQKWI